MEKYYWQGEPVKVEFGTAYVKEEKEKPLYWYNFECNWDVDFNKKRYLGAALIPAIKIYYRDEEPFIISNHCGIGVNKLLKGGSPRDRHFSIPYNVKFESEDSIFPKELKGVFVIKKFDEDAFVAHEIQRRKWQKRNFPKEFQKMEDLRNAFHRKQS